MMTPTSSNGTKLVALDGKQMNEFWLLTRNYALCMLLIGGLFTACIVSQQHRTMEAVQDVVDAQYEQIKYLRILVECLQKGNGTGT